MYRPAVVLVVFVLAGCSAVSLGGGGPTTPSETVTPVPITTGPTDQTATSEPLPPGVDADGTVVSGTLSSAHTDYLANRSYTWFVRYDSGNEELAGGTFVRRAVVDNDTFVVEQVSPGPGANTSVYVNETGGFLRSVDDNDTRYDYLRVPGEPTDYTFASDTIRRFLGGSQFTVTEVDRRGRAYYRLHAADGPVPVMLAQSSTTAQNYTATAYVTSEGFVRSLTVAYDRSVAGNRSRVTFRYDYRQVGDSVPVAPRWVAEIDRRSTPTPVTTAE